MCGLQQYLQKHKIDLIFKVYRIVCTALRFVFYCTHHSIAALAYYYVNDRA